MPFILIPGGSNHMAYKSLDSIVQYCAEHGAAFDEAVLEDDMQERDVTREDSLSSMKSMWQAMKEAASSYDPSLKSASGLSGGQGALMSAYMEQGDTLCGPFINSVIRAALQMGESNACMKRIVAAPTAGACGVLPAVLIPGCAKFGFEDEKMIRSLYVAAGIGQVIAERAYIAGALGGCQAEIGSASAMAAGALVFLKGGSPDMILNAVAIALKSLLGLVCDPVAGLVEVPCIKRNVLGAVNALTSADMALAGIVSFVPADQVIDAMKEVGDKMHASLKETSLGGLAASKSARNLQF